MAPGLRVRVLSSQTQRLLETRYGFPWGSIWFSLGAVVTLRVLVHLNPLPASPPARCAP